MENENQNFREKLTAGLGQFWMPMVGHFSMPIDKRAMQSGKKAVKASPKAFDSHFCLGRAYRESGDFNNALAEMKKAESMAWQKEDLGSIASWLGSTYYNMGNKEEALKQYERSLALSRDLGNKKAEASALTNIGNILRDYRNYEKALQYYEESLKLWEDDDKDKARTCNGIALIYTHRRDYTKAVEYLNKAIEASSRAGDYHALAICELNLGDTYRLKGAYTDAEKQLKDGLEKIKKVGDKYWEAHAYKYLGWLYGYMGDRPLAIQFLQASFDLALKIGAKDLAEDAHNSINKLN